MLSASQKRRGVLRPWPLTLRSWAPEPRSSGSSRMFWQPRPVGVPLSAQSYHPPGQKAVGSGSEARGPWGPCTMIRAPTQKVLNCSPGFQGLGIGQAQERGAGLAGDIGRPEGEQLAGETAELGLEGGRPWGGGLTSNAPLCTPQGPWRGWVSKCWFRL